MALLLPEVPESDSAQTLYESILGSTLGMECQKCELNARQSQTLSEISLLSDALQYTLAQCCKQTVERYVVVLNGVVNTQTGMHGSIIVSAHLEPSQEGPMYIIDDAVSYSQDGKVILTQGGMPVAEPGISMEHCIVTEVL